MIKVEKLTIGDKDYECLVMETENTKLLIIKAEKGFLGCGYINIEVANKVGDAVAIVTGVKTFDDMLKANVVKISEKAKKLGIQEGVSGREALEKL